MKKIQRVLLLTTTLAVSTVASNLQPATAQAERINPVGRWQCQQTYQGIARHSKHVAALQKMVIDVSQDGSFRMQGIQETPYGNHQMQGSGMTAIERQYISFNGHMEISNPQLPYMQMAIGGVARDGRNFHSQYKNHEAKITHGCQKISG